MLHQPLRHLFLFVAVTILSFAVAGQACPPPGLHATPVKHLNSKGQTEAYPHLSADGLRLYFTARRDSGFGKIYYAERETVTDDFTTYRPLSANLTDGFFAGSLTADEQTIYLTTHQGIFVSQRRDGGDFSKPEEVKELYGGFAVAVSPDGKEIMALHTDRYLMYRKDENGIFKRTSAIYPPPNFSIEPGQFSKDGLSFYVTVEKKNADTDEDRVDSSWLLKFTRPSLQDSFDRYEVIQKETALPFLCQVSFNDDESILVGVKGVSKWEENDLTYSRMKKTTPQHNKTNRIDSLKLEVIQFTVNRREDSSGLADIDFVLRLINTAASPVLLPVNENLFGFSSQASELCMAVPEGEPELRFSCPSRKMRISVAKRTLAPGESIMFKKQHTMLMDPAREYSIHLQCRPIESRIYAEAKWQIVPENYFL